MQHLPILKICSCPCQAGPKGRQLLFPLAKKGMTVYSLSSDKKAMTVILSTKSPPTIIMTRSKTRLSSP